MAAGMDYLGVKDDSGLQKRAQVRPRLAGSEIQESHAHGVRLHAESPTIRE